MTTNNNQDAELTHSAYSAERGGKPPRGQRVIVCGGIRFNDFALVSAVLNRLNDSWPIRCIIQGAGPGADELAVSWARARSITVISFPPNFRCSGEAAVPKQNADMLELASPDLVVAFPGGKGTADMVERAIAKGVDVLDLRGQT